MKFDRSNNSLIARMGVRRRRSIGLMAVVAAVSTGSAHSETPNMSKPQFDLEILATLDNPWAMAPLPDGRVLVTEKPGRLRVLEKGGALSEPIRGVPAVSYRDQGGLLGVALHPKFSSNGYVYIAYVEAAESQHGNAENKRDTRIGDGQELDDLTLKGLAVARGRLEGNALENVEIIWRQTPKMVGRGHFGGRLLFDEEGKLYITSGERQRFLPAQDLRSNAGKIVRINDDGTVPDDNPFAAKDGASADIWTLGHRNPLGIAIEPGTGTLWVHEMGPKGGDELNKIIRGRDYGWPSVSEGDHYDGGEIPRHASDGTFEKPVKSWTPVISPSGFIFYRGDAFPEWRNSALIGGLSSKALLRLEIDNGKLKSEERFELGRRIRDVAQTADGRLLLLSDGDDGALLAVTPRAGSRAAR